MNNRDELIIALAFIVSSAIPSLLVLGWRRLRNLDRIEAAQRQARIAHKITYTAQEATRASRLQLAACRAVLAEVMSERDHYRAQMAHLAGKIIELERQRRQERLMARTWLTRTILSRKVSEN